MLEQYPTSDLALPYYAIPRVDEQFLVQPDSYVDIMLPSTVNNRARLRLHDINERWIRAMDLSGFKGYVPDDDRLLEAPYGAFDDFELDKEFYIGREYNPDELPILNHNVISRKHLSLTVSLGERGLMLAIKDLGSHNGTEIVLNDTLTPYVPTYQPLRLVS